MTIGKVGRNWIYFTAHDYEEPTHAHASLKKREIGAAKFWVYKDGSTKIAAKGNLDEREIRRIQNFLKNNYMILFSEWETEFKVLRIYGEPNKEFTVVKGELIEKTLP